MNALPVSRSFFRPISRLAADPDPLIAPGVALAVAFLSGLLGFGSSLAAQTPAAAGASAPVPAAVAAPVAGPSITLPFFVLNKKEEPVLNLTKDDITVGEDGHPETIQAMMAAGNEPVTIAILVDTRASQSAMVQSSPGPLEHFLDGLMTRPADQAAVIDFNDDAGLDLPLTADHAKVHSALERLKPRPAGAYSTTEVDKNVGGNVLFDALFLASDEVLKGRPGRRIVLVLTDGLDRGSKENILSAIEAAQRARALIYTIQFPSKERDEPRGDPSQNPGGPQGGGYPGGGGGYPGGGGWPGGGGGYPGGGRRGGQRAPSPTRKDPKKVLVQLAGDTGGHYYDVSSKGSLDQALGKMADQLKAEYTLTYALNRDDREEGFHRLQWGTKSKDQLLQAPGGFYIEQP